MSDINTTITDTAVEGKAVTTAPFKFTPAMFTPFNVVKMVTIVVAPVVAVLHFTIHQSLTADAVEFGVGGAFVAWFFLLLCNPHLVDKIPSRTWSSHDEMVSDWERRSNPAYSYEIDNIWYLDQDLNP